MSQVIPSSFNCWYTWYCMRLFFFFTVWYEPTSVEKCTRIVPMLKKVSYISPNFGEYCQLVEALSGKKISSVYLSSINQTHQTFSITWRTPSFSSPLYSCIASFLLTSILSLLSPCFSPSHSLISFYMTLFLYPISSCFFVLCCSHASISSITVANVM